MCRLLNVNTQRPLSFNKVFVELPGLVRKNCKLDQNPRGSGIFSGDRRSGAESI